MIREAIDRIVGMARENMAGTPFEYNGRNYYRDNAGKLNWIMPPHFNQPAKVTFSSLSALVAYIQQRRSDIEKDAFLQVMSPETVVLLGVLQPENDNTRFVYGGASIKEEKQGFRFDTYMELEMFIIRLQTHFVPSATVDRIIDMLGNVANDHVVTNADDKFSQKLAVRTGITTKEDVTVENPVRLAPYRTFREVAQPELPCVLRLRNQDGIQCSLFEAGGEAWKLEAMQNVAQYLSGNDGMPPVFV